MSFPSFYFITGNYTKLLNREPTWSNIIDPEFWSDYHITDMVHPRRAKKNWRIFANNIKDQNSKIKK